MSAKRSKGVDLRGAEFRGAEGTGVQMHVDRVQMKGSRGVQRVQVSRGAEVQGS